MLGERRTFLVDGNHNVTALAKARQSCGGGSELFKYLTLTTASSMAESARAKCHVSEHTSRQLPVRPANA